MLSEEIVTSHELSAGATSLLKVRQSTTDALLSVAGGGVEIAGVGSGNVVRPVAPYVSSIQLDELRAAQASLAAKKVKGLLDSRGRKELVMIRWLIDKAEESEVRASFAQLELLVGAQERIAAEISSFIDTASGLMRGKSKR